MKWVVKSFQYNNDVEDYLNFLDENTQAVRYVTETSGGYTVFVQEYSDGASD